MLYNLKGIKMKQPLLENSDAIVLLSILYASEFGKQPVSLGGIISSFDFIDHAIITYDELKGALCRLTKNNYITESNTLEFLPTKNIVDDFNKYKLLNKKMNFMLELDYIKELINAKDWVVGIDYVKVNEKYKYRGLTTEKYQITLNEYLNN